MEFKIDDYLSLRLVGNKTLIYIKDKEFMHCSRLLLTIPKNNFANFEEINSLDEASDVYKTLLQGKVHEGGSHAIAPEQEFWGHCSNLQTWVEHGYDTRILTSNLSFPLLRELVRAGNSDAKKVFRDEIAKRFSEGYYSVVAYLIVGGYLNNFDSEETDTLFRDFDYHNLLKVISQDVPHIFSILIKDKRHNANKVYKDWLSRQFREGDYETINSLILKGYLKILDEQDLKLVFNVINFDDIKLRRSWIMILMPLMRSGSHVAKKSFIEVASNRLKNDEEFEEFAHFIIGGTLDSYGDDFIFEIFRNFDYEYFIEKSPDIMPLFLKKLIDIGIFEAKEQYIKKEFLQRYISIEEIPFFLEFSSKMKGSVKICIEKYKRLPTNTPYPPAVVINKKRITEIYIKKIDESKLPDSITDLSCLKEIKIQ